MAELLPITLFIGDIVSAEIDSPPDVTLTLSANQSSKRGKNYFFQWRHAQAE